MITINHEPHDWPGGLSVTALLRQAGYDCPLITVTVNGSFVAEDDYDDTIVFDGSVVQVIHLHHGG
jgi:thiamine biosynthesis protein ThiS